MAVLAPVFPIAIAGGAAYGAYKTKQKVDREKVTTCAGGFVFPSKPAATKGMSFGQWDPECGEFVPSAAYNGLMAPRQAMNSEDVRAFRKEIVAGNSVHGAQRVIAERNTPKGGTVVHAARVTRRVTANEKARTGMNQPVYGTLAGPTGREGLIGPNGTVSGSVIATGFGAGHSVARSHVPGMPGSFVPSSCASSVVAPSVVPSVAAARQTYPPAFAPSVVPGSLVSAAVHGTYPSAFAPSVTPGSVVSSYSGTYSNGGYVF